MTLDALFSFDGERYHPSELTRGPWRPDAQHGGPPAALLSHALETGVGIDEHVAQVEVELVRPVPLAALAAEVRFERVSGRVRRAHAELLDGEDVVARANALLLRRADLPKPGWVGENDGPAADPPDPGLRVAAPRAGSDRATAYHRNAVEHRFTGGTFLELGPAVDWIRLRQPVVAGVEPSPLQRVLAAADFGSGISAIYEVASSFGLINANLTVSLHRLPIGEWVSLDAHTRADPEAGTGLCITTLGDLRGRIGVATQSLLGYSS